MKYDPIMCMNAPESKKTKDANYYKVYGPKGIEVYEARTKEAAIRKYEIEYGTAVTAVEQVKDDEASKGRTHDVLNKAIRSCDANFVILPEISDTWRFIDKYNLKYTKTSKGIQIDIDEAVKNGANKEYINKLSKMSKMYGKGDF